MIDWELESVTVLETGSREVAAAWMNSNSVEGNLEKKRSLMGKSTLEGYTS